MSGAALPPIALDAVRKILAICQDNVHAKKPVKPIEKPKFRLELVPPTAGFSSPASHAKARNVSHARHRRPAGKAMPTASHGNAEGAESC